jgi:hypothetical protein
LCLVRFVPMRMPLFSYFAVVGITLTLGLLYVSSRLEPAPVLPTSQIVGLAKPFTPEPERSPYVVTATNFAAPHKSETEAIGRMASESRTTRAADISPRQKSTANAERPRLSTWKHIAQNPIAALMSIH